MHVSYLNFMKWQNAVRLTRIVILWNTATMGGAGTWVGNSDDLRESCDLIVSSFNYFFIVIILLITYAYFSFPMKSSYIL